MWPLVWIYKCEQLQPALTGWRRPVWLGSDEWAGGDVETTKWRRTIAVRLPGRRYLIVAIPIRLSHKENHEAH